MGKTIESYRMALEDEINRWNGFQKALRTEDRVAFEALMDGCRSFASAGSNANPTHTLRTHDNIDVTISTKKDHSIREGFGCNQVPALK
jgi:hypothetical protein